jgi:hypothetical protein
MSAPADRHDVTLNRMFVAAILAGQIKASAAVRGPALELTDDGWQVYDGESPTPTPVSVSLAYEIAQRDGHGQDVLDQTRQLCGKLRLDAKRRDGRGRRAAQNLLSLRDGLAAARAIRNTTGGE